MTRQQELRESRTAAGLSMAEAARLTGTPYRTWQCWEDEGLGGRRPPGIAFAWLEAHKKTEEEDMEKFELLELGEAIATTRAAVIRAAGSLVGRMARREDGSVYLSATESRTDYADKTLAEYAEADFLEPYFTRRILRDLGQ